MTFVNEYASEEDIKKYNLEELKLRYHVHLRRTGWPYKKHMWTIDREKQIFLICVDHGREEHSNRHIWVMRTQDEEVEIITDRIGVSKKFTEDPYILEWDLINLKSSESGSLSREGIIKLLKEALTSYGNDGTDKFVKNAVVNFNF